MAGNKVRALVDQVLGKSDEQEHLHIQTVKITEVAHARLRALSDLAGRSKTSLAADLLMAAIDDAIEALPDDPVDDPSLELKLLGMTLPADSPELGIRDLVGFSAHQYLQSDAAEAERQADLVKKASSARVNAQQVVQNGARK